MVSWLDATPIVILNHAKVKIAIHWQMAIKSSLSDN